MRKYCEQCEKEAETKVITKREAYQVCGELIEVDAQVLVCSECGDELFCEELDNATLVKAYNEYRRVHKLLLPEEIRKIREQYGLSQRSCSTGEIKLFADMKMGLFRIKRIIAFFYSFVNLKT